MKEKLKVILTGATGMIGEGVLHECLLDDRVEEVLLIGRRVSGINHVKVKEIIHSDFSNLEAIEDKLIGYNTCFFCSGVSSVGMSEKDYGEKTYFITIQFAKTLRKVNPQLSFCYISGSATDSTEKGRVMWARVKGKTENELLRMFASAYMFRPSYMQPTPGLKNVLKYYKYISWMYPFLRLTFPKFVCSMRELGQSMINTTYSGCDKKILEVGDIVQQAGNNK